VQGIDVAHRVNATAASVQSSTSPAVVPSTRQWLLTLVPDNLVRTAADGALLPLVLFSIAFGRALSSIDEAKRQQVTLFFSGITDAFLRLVASLVELAPFAVFALAVPLAARTGWGLAGTLGWYVVVAAGVHILVTCVCYVVAATLGNVPFLRFVQAVAPAQAFAFSSRSSLAALPATFVAAESLGLDAGVSAFFLPLSASIFRVAGAANQVVAVLFLTHLYSIPLGPLQLLSLLAMAALTSLTSPGVPGGVLLVIAPVLAAFGVPAASLGLLLAVDALADMFRTVSNVTAWVAAGQILGRYSRGIAVSSEQVG
jgi:proton glutamate symport protein